MVIFVTHTAWYLGFKAILVHNLWYSTVDVLALDVIAIVHSLLSFLALLKCNKSGVRVIINALWFVFVKLRNLLIISNIRKKIEYFYINSEWWSSKWWKSILIPVHCFLNVLSWGLWFNLLVVRRAFVYLFCFRDVVIDSTSNLNLRESEREWENY